jgi:hypothetical protein
MQVPPAPPPGVPAPSLAVPTPSRPTLEAAAARLAAVLGSEGARRELVDAGEGSGRLVAEEEARPRPLSRARRPPEDLWAVDGGQATVADARCLRVVVTRVARVRVLGGSSVVEEQGPLEAHLVGVGQDPFGLESLSQRGLELPARTPVDADLLREAGEWAVLRRTVEEADPGALVLVDGDLFPDPRVPEEQAAAVVQEASARRVMVAGVTKHSSLCRSGVPLVASLEAIAERDPALGPAARWWAPVARSRPGASLEVQVAVARLDPAARFAFRVDLPAGVDAAAVLEGLAAMSDDAAFPGYPYPLAAADRLAACPPWLRDEARMELFEHLERLGVDVAQRDRCFADRHRLMERA